MIGERAQDVDCAAFDIISLKLATKGELPALGRGQPTHGDIVLVHREAEGRMSTDQHLVVSFEKRAQRLNPTAVVVARRVAQVPLGLHLSVGCAVAGVGDGNGWNSTLFGGLIGHDSRLHWLYLHHYPSIPVRSVRC